MEKGDTDQLVEAIERAAFNNRTQVASLPEGALVMAINEELSRLGVFSIDLSRPDTLKAAEVARREVFELQGVGFSAWYQSRGVLALLRALRPRPLGPRRGDAWYAFWVGGRLWQLLAPLETRPEA